jgi:hypothetical protein
LLLSGAAQYVMGDYNRCANQEFWSRLAALDPSSAFRLRVLNGSSFSKGEPLPLSSEGPLLQVTAPDEGRLDDPAARVRDRATVIQKRTGRPVQFEITEQTRAAIGDWADGARHSA